MRRRTHEPITISASIVFGALSLIWLLAGCGGSGTADRPGTGDGGATTGTSVSGGYDHGDRSTTAIAPTKPGKMQDVAGRAPGTETIPETTVTGTPEIPIVPPDPIEVKTAWKEGLALFEQGDHAGAVERLRLVALGREDVFDVHYLLGLSLWRSGELGEAENALMHACSLEAGSIRSRINLARVRIDRDDARGAIEAIDEALAIDPESAAALHQKGRALSLLDRTDEAVDVLTRARSIDPENGWIANTLGYVLIRSERFSEAVPHLEDASGTLPRVAFVRNNLGVAYERTGRTEQAYMEYRAAVEAGDSGGKAGASIARIEPIVRSILARRGEVLPPPVTVGGDSPESAGPGETVAVNLPPTPPSVPETASGTTKPDVTEEDTDGQ